MKKLLTMMFLLMLLSTTNAQVFQISAYSYSSHVSGDFAKKEINNSNAGYIDYAYGGGVEFKYFLNRLGFGLKWSYCDYGRDIVSYQADLKNLLGITDEQYIMNQFDSFYSNSFLLGLSYLFKLSPKFQLEPYFNFGTKIFLSPFEHTVYSINNSTHTYRKDAKLYYGFCYLPGIKIYWNITKHIGLSLFTEYESSSLFEEVEVSVIYNSDSFDKYSIKKSYNPKSVNIGLGFSYSFGKGLDTQ